MDLETARQRFASARVARLATASDSGQPHLVPLVFAVRNDLGHGHTVCFAVDHKPKRSRQLRRLDNIAANPAVSLLVDHYDDDWSTLWWVRVDGTATVLDAESDDGRSAIDALVDKYRQYDEVRPAGPVVVVRELTWHWWSAEVASD